jgi:hypothetical protein
VTGAVTGAGATSARLAAAGLVGVAVFQAALAAGAPWGAAAWGGRHAGTLPAQLRVGSAVSAAALSGLALVAATGPRPPEPWRRGVLTGASALLALGAPLNLASPSPAERPWAVVAGGVSVLLWRSVRAAR